MLTITKNGIHIILKLLWMHKRNFEEHSEFDSGVENIWMVSLYQGLFSEKLNGYMYLLYSVRQVQDTTR